MIKRVMFVMIVLFGIWIDPSHAKKMWEQQKGTNFIIYYRDVPEDFVNTVMEEAELSFKSVTENLGITRYEGWHWAKRASIYIYKDENDYIQNGGQAGWSHGSALVTMKTIMTYPAASGFFDSILPHELGHIILYEIVGPVANMPLWFNEGVAMYQEKAKRLGSHQVVKKSIENGQFIPLTELTNMRLYKNSKDNDVELFYAESDSIVNFMISELGEARFYKLCRELKNYTPFESALPKVYMRVKDIKTLNKLWMQYLEEQ